ncbi:MAG TPA: hypothetical protein VK279_01310 [Solirubrobacteraceae bacterium]|nr:hypothetical protein [Solirubrobacteraceae bacterium]
MSRDPDLAPRSAAVPHHRAVRSAVLIAAMVLGALCIWTASPAAWLWVASQMEGGGPPTMEAIAVVVIGVGLTTLALGKLLAVLDARHRALYRRRRTIRIHLPWLRSMRGERVRETGPSVELTVLDVILVASVIIAVALYNVWFLFESGSPIDLRTGRG